MPTGVVRHLEAEGQSSFVPVNGQALFIGSYTGARCAHGFDGSDSLEGLQPEYNLRNQAFARGFGRLGEQR